MFMRILKGTEKQVAWATDIRKIAIELLENKKEVRADLKDYIDMAIENIEDIDDAGYLITNLKDITYKKNAVERFEILISWMEYTKHEDFKGLLFGLNHKQNDLVEEYRELSKNINLKQRRKSWIDDYVTIEVLQCDF